MKYIIYCNIAYELKAYKWSINKFEQVIPWSFVNENSQMYNERILNGPANILSVSVFQ
jgi:hypothetical protein